METIHLEGPHDHLFFIIALASRFVQGLGDAMVTVASFSIITIEFPDEREKYIGWLETCCGLGLLAGPLIGQTVYIFAKYAGTFYFLAGFFFFCLIVAAYMLPKRLNTYDTEFPRTETILTNSIRHSHSLRAAIHLPIAERSSLSITKFARNSAAFG